jgi:crossover junction endodeoxyribonuclease RuvC
MRVLGIDPGTRHCGYGVVESHASRIAWVAHGVISPRASDPLELRLRAIHAGLEQVIRDTRPESAGVEEVFFAANVKSALILGHARGIALLVAAQAGLEVASYAATVVKQAVVGTGRAEKPQVSRMVSVILGLPALEQADASDALAIAITHCTRGAAPGLLARSVPASTRNDSGIRKGRS